MINLDQIKDWLHEKLSASSDFVFKDLQHNGNTIQVLYLKSICEEEQIKQNVILPFFQTDTLQQYECYIRSIENQVMPGNVLDLLRQVMQGEVVIFAGESLLTLPVKKKVNTTPENAEVKISVIGPKKAFSEDIEVNLNLVRSRYAKASLTIERYQIGSESGKKLAIVFDRGLTDETVLDEVRSKVKNLNPDLIIQAAGQLQRNLNTGKRALFPTMVVTERQDRVAFNLSQGKVVILLDGTLFAVIVPAVFYDYMSAMDDLYTPYWVSRFMLGLRYTGLFINLTLASFYVGFTSYNPEFLRIQVALSIAGSRAPVPYPSYIEVLFMLLMMSLLTEASIRLPKTIGSTATTVGGLILGQAATQAGLVSNIMIIIVSAVAISTFTIPLNEMMVAMRVIRYLLLFVTAIFGLIGLVLAMVGLIGYLVNLESFGQPFLKLFVETKGRPKTIKRME